MSAVRKGIAIIEAMLGVDKLAEAACAPATQERQLSVYESEHWRVTHYDSGRLSVVALWALGPGLEGLEMEVFRLSTREPAPN